MNDTDASENYNENNLENSNPTVDEPQPEIIESMAEEENVILPGIDDLPLFANEEARTIDADIKEKEGKIEKTVDLIVDMKERIKVMKGHFNNVETEVDHTNRLLESKNNEVRTETHLRQLATRLYSRSLADSKKLQSEIEMVQDQLNVVQSEIYKANENMEEFKMQMNWNQQELEQWAVVVKQKEEDNLALQRYTRADEIKIKELNLRLEQLNKELLLEKSKLNDESGETVAKQTELDRVAQEFKDAHLERQSLISQWQTTIEEMKRRDRDINDLGERFAVAKAERTKKDVLIVALRKRLDLQLAENRDVESKADSLGRIVSRKREEMISNSLKVREFRDELDSLKNELTTAADSILTKRSGNMNKNQLNVQRRVQLERQRQLYQRVKEKTEAIKNATADVEVSAKSAEDDLEAKEKELEGQLNKCKVLKDKLFKESQFIHETKSEELRLRTELAGSKTAIKNLEGQLAQLDKDAARQQELLYNAEFQIQQIERKISRGLGERSDEEKRALKRQLDENEKEVELWRAKKKMLTGQARKLLVEYNSSVVRRDELIVQKSKLQERLVELELENRMIEEAMKKEIKIKEDVTVQNDLLRLEVRRLRDLLSAKADSVFSLENRKQQLTLSMEERKQEIAVHRDVLKAELRSLNDEKHKMTMELRGREGHVNKLRSRFEATSKQDDDAHSQSYYIILAAQKKEELRRRGDELDAAVMRCEREIRALQTTLDHLNARNKAYRESFQKVDLQGDDAEVLRQLEERTKIGKDTLFRKKKELQRLTTDLEEDQRRLNQLKAQVEKAAEQRANLQKAHEQVEEEAQTLRSQMSGLAVKIEKLSGKHRGKLRELNPNMDSERAFAHGTLEEKMARAEVLKDVVQNVLYTLGQLAGEFPEVSDLLSSKLQEADLRMPSRLPMRVLGSRGGAVASNGATPIKAPIGAGPVGSRGSVKPTSFNVEF